MTNFDIHQSTADSQGATSISSSRQEHCTLLGNQSAHLVPAFTASPMRYVSLLTKLFVLATLTFVGVHVQARSLGSLPPPPITPESMPEYLVESGVMPLQEVAVLSPLERMQKKLADRRADRAKKAQNREPLHSAAPERLSPQVLNQNGIYLGATSIKRTDFFDDTLSRLQESNGNAVIFDVKGGGVLYRSSAPIATELGLVRSHYDLPAVIQKLKEQKVHVMGRFVAIKDEAFTAKRPDTRVKHPTSGRVLNQTWIDPANDDAIQFNMQIICELAAAGIDEINLDYIRFSTAEVGALSALDREEKSARVEKFVKAARETIDRCGPATRLGLSTYAILGWSYDVNVETLGQDIVKLAPYVDVISPMAYPATFSVDGGYYNPAKHGSSRMYHLVHRTLTGYQELLGDQSWKLRPWIQGYGVTTKNMQDQIAAVYDAGLCGYQVWNANNNYAPTYAGMKSTVIPAHCQQAVAVR
ncbi:MAG: putative glycoside hydrolase [Candidatus Peribacteraceae bacterium]